MATQVQIRRGTSSQVAAFTGAEGEIVVNTTNDSIHVNDGSSAGGFEMARVDGSNWNVTNNISTTGSLTAASLVVDTTTLVVDATNNRVGIGTSIPSFPLHVSGSSTNYVMSETTGTGTSSGFRLKGDASADFTLFTTQGTNQFAIYDNANSAERLRIDSSGNVGIGTSNATPSNGEGMCLGSGSTITRLDIRNSTTGDATGDGTSLQLNGNNFTIENREAGYVAFATSLTERVRIDSSGAVIFKGSLAAHQTNAGTAEYESNIFTLRAYGATAGTGQFRVLTGGGGGSAASEAMRIDSSQRQIIGHTASVGTAYQTNLQVKGSTASNYAGLGVISTNNEMLGVVGTWSNNENSLMIAADPDNLRSSSSIVFTTDATERARIDQNGTLLLTTPVGGAYGYLNIKEAGNGDVRFGMESGIDYDAIAGTFTNNSFKFYTNSTNRMTLTSGGNLLVGTTSSSQSVGEGSKFVSNGRLFQVSSYDANTQESLSMYSTGAGAFRFFVGWGGTVYATNTSISAVSDQRLKENIRDLDVGLDAVLALKPRKFDWKEGKGKDIKDDRGFVAQEFEEIFPDLIDEWKDPVPEGEEPYKSVRQDLIPVLVKAIQEQQATITALEARITQLENN